ncbi:MAG: cytochrome c maturation protein CcmE [Desulfonatronovibrionaceae bacterium]
MAKKKSRKWVYALAFVLILGGVGFLFYTGISQNRVYFLEVSEALARSPSDLGQARVFGKVSADSIERRKDSLGVSFDLLDKEEPSQSIRVSYAGAVPDTFDPGVEVIVEGTFQSGGHAFRAEKLMTKCPSKYEDESGS